MRSKIVTRASSACATVRTAGGIVAVAWTATLLAASATATYLHESHRPGMLWLSNPGLKRGFVVQAPVPAALLSRPEASKILSAPPAPGLFEQPNGPRIPEGTCLGDDATVDRCARQWESTRLKEGKGIASRNASTLTLSTKTGAKLVLADWENCSPEGECDGERFLYLGRFDRSAYQAVEVEYEHDSPSLVLFDPSDGKVAAVHYGSELTFLNSAATLLVSVEDLNDATTLLVTRLDGDGPAIDLHCLGTRTESSSFGVTFKRWGSDASFDVVLLKAGQSFVARFERSAEGAWTVRSPVALKGEGFECRQRG